MSNPNSLVIWEAQFGDFANGAQVIIDQFICSGEAKWNVKSGLVMLLPHGYDGQGPEHSSSRMERYLQLCNQDELLPANPEKYDNVEVKKEVNMQVLNCTTAANYFHALRTHMRMPFRKPMIVVAPKKLLKLRLASSNIEAFAEGTRFQEIIPDPNTELVKPEKVRKVVLCSGQVYYDLVAAVKKDGKNDIAVIRIESVCPFPFKEIIEQLKSFKNAKLTWAQEEPKNAGGWIYAQPRLMNILTHLGKGVQDVHYAGRPYMAASAVGYTKSHNEQLAALLKEALS
jgi:2-oxoglutarate dehydrogenase E1 component